MRIFLKFVAQQILGEEIEQFLKVLFSAEMYYNQLKSQVVIQNLKSSGN